MSDITAFTAIIVSAYVSKNNIPADDLVALLKDVHGTMSGIMKHEPATLEDSKPAPVVSIKKSVRNDAITCLACGMHLKTLKRHVMASHGQTLADYKAHWSLPQDYPTTAPAYAETRSALATKAGLGRQPRTAGKALEARVKNAHAPKQTKEAAPQLKKKTRKMAA